MGRLVGLVVIGQWILGVQDKEILVIGVRLKEGDGVIIMHLNPRIAGFI